MNFCRMADGKQQQTTEPCTGLTYVQGTLGLLQPTQLVLVLRPLRDRIVFAIVAVFAGLAATAESIQIHMTHSLL